MKRKVLIVEDNLIPSLALEVMLADEGYEVVGKLVSDDGFIEMVKEKQPDIILMDIRLKNSLSGIELAQQLRTFSNTLVVFVSALTDNATLTSIKEIPNTVRVSKPYSEEDLLHALKQVEK